MKEVLLIKNNLLVIADDYPMIKALALFKAFAKPSYVLLAKI
jgi:hypothetical protein